ncbi:Na+/H+ antiporter subunit E [Nocardiopsis sp. L17-MgMaSL7]|uniref:Na+/H+ antiporter subunit E n=1 Tax=Nocardiopsis sp. L17-MgMaSL7 TaxID=1938893 RepID=UPI000D70BE21|nr:Na+/H+ antiporter subunit E [Nocardiopsis sp. L17-MgMaSL7]PWV51027.1 multisubunit sodium/proton antiporter MrpE subunit [Nocardiopsis sp. L17-MgMaSL7]
MNDLNTRKKQGVRAVRHRLGKVQIPVALGMTVVWMLLFDGFQPRTESLGIALLGFTVSVAIMMVFPLPPIVPGFRFWPVQGVRMFFYVLVKMAVASFQVTAQVFRPGPPVKSSVVSVRLRTDSDLMLVCTAITVSVIPGSVIVEVAQPEHVLYVHVLGAESEAEAEKAKEDILELEERIVRALGTRENIAELEAAQAAGKGNT